MIGHAVLAVVVGADFVLAAGPRDAAHDRAAEQHQLLVALVAFALGQLGPQDLPRLFAVLVLRAGVLHRDHDAARHVGQPDGRVGLVDVLAPGAAGAHRLRPHRARVDVVVRGRVVEIQRRVGFRRATAGGGQAGQDQYRHSGRVGAALLLGGGDALDAVDAGLGAQDVVGAWVGDLEHRVREAGLAGRRRVVGHERE